MSPEQIMKEFEDYVTRYDERIADGRVDLFSLTEEDLRDTYMPSPDESPDESTPHQELINWIIRLSVSVAFDYDMDAARKWLTSPLSSLNGQTPSQLMVTQEGALEVFRQLRITC